MIAGTVVNRRPTVPLTVRGPSGLEVIVEALLDTGFNGFLTLPTTTVTSLGLPYRNQFRAGLADGSVIQLAVHAAVVLWNGALRRVEVLVTDRQPLLGTALLNGHELIIRFAEGDRVTIQPL
jgi:clan AA aspartic protease